MKLRVVFKREKKRRKERKACATEKNLMMKLKFVIIGIIYIKSNRAQL